MRAVAITCLLMSLIGCHTEQSTQDESTKVAENDAPSVAETRSNTASERPFPEIREPQLPSLDRNELAPETAADLPEAETFALKPRQSVMSGLVNYYRPLRIQLSNTPHEQLVDEPEYASKSPLYGILTVGEGPDNRISIVVDESESENSRIYVDRNNDEDLTNDGSGNWSRNTSQTLGLSNVTVDVPYGTDVIPATFEFYRFKTRMRDVVLYYRNSAREGTLQVGDAEYQIAILDENSDGRYDDLDNGTLLIDLNKDGQLVGRSDSAEHHALGQPFNIHGKVFEVVSLSTDGTRLSIAPSSAQVEMRAYLTEGNQAPFFAGKTLNDDQVDLVSLAAGADYILLDFWASWCGPCRQEYPYLRRLNARYKEHGLRIIGINLDSSREKAIQAARENQLDYPHVFDGQGWKNAVAVLYRVHGIPATYLLDKDLNIVARGLRGATLESRMASLLGPGDAEAVEALEVELKDTTSLNDRRQSPGAAPTSTSPTIPQKASSSNPASDGYLPQPNTIMDNGRIDRQDFILWAFDWPDVEKASRYHLYVTGRNARIPVINDDELTESKYLHQRRGSYIAGSNLKGWTWKVRAFVNGKWGEWSPSREFDVEPVNSDPPLKE